MFIRIIISNLCLVVTLFASHVSTVCIDDVFMVDLIGFKYLKNPAVTICDLDNIDLLIYVHSSPANLKKRLTIRETWAKRSLFPQTRLVFMLGSTPDQDLTDRISLESHIYNDIVQQDFLDSYRNLTFKAMMALDWLVKYCSQARYVLKTDDDVVVSAFLSSL